MISRKYLITLACSFCFSLCCMVGVAQQTETGAWPEITKEARPWTRWWWMGSAVDKLNISRLLDEYNKAGIGGVEIAPIYGAKGHESHYIDYLSPKWMEMLHHTLDKASKLEMGVDLPLGTGWPFGGPQITPEHAATRLFVETYSLQKGKRLSEKIAVTEPKQKKGNIKLQAVTAYSDKGEVLKLLDKVDSTGTLNWSPKTGDWKIYAAFAGKTQQMVKRAAPGGEGFTLDHLSKDALGRYLKRFETAFNGGHLGVRAFYNDSYEVYNADWSPNFFTEFEKRRGYDLRLHLQELSSKDKNDAVARIKSDYRETMSVMLLDNFTKPWTSWSRRYNGITKNQAHGSPGNLLDLYAAVDIPEGETFGSSYFPIPGLRRDSADDRNVDPDPLMLKFASSAANATGKPLISAETFTWLTEHFRTSLSQCKPEVEQVFLSGINHVFYHGTTYSPGNVEWPGWLFYASVNMVPANSFWKHSAGLNDYIARVQSVLQTGKPDNEILVYWPVYDVWHDAKGRDKPLNVHEVDAWLHPTNFYKTSKSLINAGFSLDFVSDKMLGDAKVANGNISTFSSANPYRILLIPKSELMSVATLRHIIRLANDGASVIFEVLPRDVPGAGNLEERRKEFNMILASLSFSQTESEYSASKIGKGEIIVSSNVQKVLAEKEIIREQLTDSGLKFIRKKFGHGCYYYLVNHTTDPINKVIRLNSVGRTVLYMDPQNGNYGLATFSNEDKGTKVLVQLEPGGAVILKVLDDKVSGIEKWNYIERKGDPLEIKGNWDLRFADGEPDLPASRKLKDLISWTSMGDDRLQSFSGTAEYTTTFNLPSLTADGYLLELGDVRESARVWINGHDAGILWSIPFKARIGKYLRSGQNTIKVEVANLMANRIRHMDKQGIEWRKYHEINFVNINYKDFDASGWEPMASGLLGPVRIVPYWNVK